MARSKSRSKSRSPKRIKSPRRSSKSPRRSSKSPHQRGASIKFFDLVAKKPFNTSNYEVVTRKTNSKNGKRLVTYYVTNNPTPRQDGKVFKNWRIVSNSKA